MEERLQKILARHGYGSRRSTEALIQAGRVMVNGIPATLGDRADPVKDTISVDQQTLPKEEPEKVYIALHKPQGVLSDDDPNDPRKTVLDLVPVHGHLFAVGRLDLDSEGLMLLTNDGDLANRLTHPRYGHEKEYRVLVASRPDEKQLEIWRRGVVLPDGHKTVPAQVEIESSAGKGAWLRVVLKEGRKRQIREVGTTIGLPVQRIIRVRIGSLLLGNLKAKEWRFLKQDEVRSLRAGVSKEQSLRRVYQKPAKGVRPFAENKKPGRKPERPGKGRTERSGSTGEQRSTNRNPKKGSVLSQDQGSGRVRVRKRRSE